MVSSSAEHIGERLRDCLKRRMTLLDDALAFTATISQDDPLDEEALDAIAAKQAEFGHARTLLDEEEAALRNEWNASAPHAPGEVSEVHALEEACKARAARVAESFTALAVRFGAQAESIREEIERSRSGFRNIEGYRSPFSEWPDRMDESV